MIPSLLRFFVVCIGLSYIAVPELKAQGGAEAELAAAMELFNAGNYEEAAKAFEAVASNYPTAAQVPEAQMRAGYANMLAGNYDRAEEYLRKILDPPAPASVQEIGYSLLPQAIAAGAAGMEPGPKRKEAFEKAIAQYGIYLQKYPQGSEVENARYGRALSYFQIEKYTEAAKDLRENLAAFPKSATLGDSQYLLALSLATQANLAMQSDAHDKAAADPLYDEAEKLLLDIHDRKTDVALANDAIFQVGEIRFNRAAFTQDEAQRNKQLQLALDAYRKVDGKERMIAVQERRLQEIQDARQPALRSGNQAEIQRLQRFYERESGKLAQIREKEDQTVAANMKAGQIFFQLGDYDAARVLMRHNQSAATSEENQRAALYYITMTYALQGLIDQAVENYQDFQSKYKGHPIASNLPLAMGTMLNTAGRAEEATKYLAEQSELYPESSFATLAVVQKANSLMGLGRYDEALKTYQDYLAANKNAPPAVAAQAEMGIANVYKDTQRWDEALAQYRKVLSTYPDDAENVKLANFWVAYSLLQKGDAAAAIKEFDSFLKKYPEDKNLGPAAMFSLAQAQLAANESGAALETFQRVATTFPGTEPASFAYFQRAQIFAGSQRTDDVIAEMQAFVKAYPEDSKVFGAYDTIGQNQLALGKMEEAIAPYAEYVEKFPATEQTPQAWLKLSELWRMKATAMGRYVALPDETRAEWNTAIDKSVTSAEQVLEKFPDSSVVALALQSLLEAQRMLVASQQKTAQDLEKYFEDFAKKFESNPGTRSKVLFTLASHLYATDPERALKIMGDAYRPEIVLAPTDLDLYGLALIDRKQLDEARAVYEKLANDFPIPAGVDPQTAPAQVQEAQAIVLFGQARILQESGDAVESAKLFERLKALYPWSPKLLEANYGIAAGLFEEGKGDEALSMLSAIIRAQTATTELRAKSMLLGGHIQKKAYEAATDTKEKTELLNAAIDYFIKIALFYEGVPALAAEGLWEGAQLLEIQASGLSEPQRGKQLAKARTAYQDLISKFPSSSYTDQARERLSALGAK